MRNTVASLGKITASIGKVIALALPLYAATGHAESGIYLGGSFGNATVGFNPNSNIDVKDDDIGYKLFGGVKFTLLAAEVGYVDFGKVEKSGFTGDLNGFNAFGILSFGLGPVSLFGKAGGFVWESDFSNAQDTYKEDGFDPAVGVGAAINLGSLGVRAEYEYYDIDGFDEVSMFSLGAVYWLF
ncbi:MAG: outer membrane beta-barrel protein [Cellvibrionaceae bacterium]|nr:outer membrane beta-barrel protein [Cellvibrionaceae bacterium]